MTKQDQSRWFTDAMGVVHHANYLLYFEDARLAYLRALGLIGLHHPYGRFVFAVVDIQNKYIRPLKWDDEYEIHLQSRIEGAKMLFQYALWLPRENTYASSGWVAVVPTDTDLKPARLPKSARDAFANSAWDTDWPPEFDALT
jgi:acyl-CoA thioester hydrolase